ncbi:MAG: hypothetical protein R3345_11815 [Fulvivirga sp.]|nr:hypothetical protein [Fulvivirga sp.]
MKFLINIIFITVILLVSCDGPNTDRNSQKSKVPASATSYSDQFADYWYAGKAEVASYSLRQARYGEMRDGHATLIFVTEPFSKKKQVKLDNPQQAGDDKMTVMKLNYVKKFNTGIYPYSMMLSAFTPVDRYHYPNTVKLSMSSQEWCGQVFTQVNLRDSKKYYVQSFSYFESEGDEKYEMENAVMEDELFNQIRLDYTKLPVGDIKIIPGLFATRLMHQPYQPQQASASLEEGEGTATYALAYENGRELEINFSLQFPYKILSWEETYTDLGNKAMTTKATLKETLHIDYWRRNSNADEYLRDSLQLQ